MLHLRTSPRKLLRGEKDSETRACQNKPRKTIQTLHRHHPTASSFVLVSLHVSQRQHKSYRVAAETVRSDAVAHDESDLATSAVITMVPAAALSSPDDSSGEHSAPAGTPAVSDSMTAAADGKHVAAPSTTTSEPVSASSGNDFDSGAAAGDVKVDGDAQSAEEASPLPLAFHSPNSAPSSPPIGIGISDDGSASLPALSLADPSSQIASN